MHRNAKKRKQEKNYLTFKFYNLRQSLVYYSNLTVAQIIYLLQNGTLSQKNTQD